MTKTKPLEVTIDRAVGGPFCFHLLQKVIGVDGFPPLRFCWMDRAWLTSSKAEYKPLDRIIYHWLSCVSSEYLTQDDVSHLVRAKLYKHFFNCKAVQGMFLDARLKAKARYYSSEESTFKVDDDSVDEIVSQGYLAVENELARILDWREEPDEWRDRISQRMEDIFNEGVALFESKFTLETLNEFSEKYGKKFKQWRRGHSEENRWLLNHLAYECKYAFYRCYANAFVDIIPKLVERGDLDAPSANLTFLLNYQWPARKLTPEVRAIYGIGANHKTCGALGYDHVKSSFFGQVISLHPVGILLINHEVYFAPLVRLANSLRFGEIVNSLDRFRYPEYAEFMKALLLAAKWYRGAYDQQNMDRGQGSVREFKEYMTPQTSSSSILERTRRYLEKLSWRCPACGSEDFVLLEAEPEVKNQCLKVGLKCEACQRVSSFTLHS